MQNSNTPITKEGHATQQAVQDYLDTLLQDATQQALVEPAIAIPDTVVETLAVETEVVETLEFEKTELETKEIETTEVKTTEIKTTVEAVVEPKVEEVAETQEIVEVAESVATETQSEKVEELQAQEWINGRPVWAQETFECLLFKVAGLTLAVPLTELGTVLTFDEELTPLFGQPDWFLGLLPSKTAGTVRVMDTAKKVMPEKYTEEARENLKFVILMKNSDWGLACHEVAEAITLTPDEVRWRTGRSQRPWLAGTVINHMCAIMDVAALVDLVNKDSAMVKAPQWSRQTAE